MDPEPGALMTGYFRSVWANSVNLLKGLALTFRYLFERKVTLQYPKEKAALPERFRGMLTFHIEECIACDLCVRACPSACISLKSERNAAGKKIIQTYTIDFGKCNWCRLCEEACPTNPKSVHHTLEYERMFHSRDDFKITWNKV
ncbi:MAG: NADH-quinone oxidoreductase subunit I [Elusimicrobiota bacterium]|jgi:NADH-quinone oxidoreductase subunit I